MIVVHTCVLNSFDFLRSSAVTPEHGVRFLCFTDRPIEPCPPWEIQPAYCPLPYAPVDMSGASVPPPPPNASRCSRLPKILPNLHFAADYSIWHDANFVLRADPATMIAAYLKHADIAMFAHPCRSTVAEEVKVLLAEKIGKREEVLNQQTAWLHMGAPCGLWAGGLIIRRHTKAVAAFNEVWWKHFKGGSTRDQLALPMAVHETGMKIETIPGNIQASALLGFHYHAAWRNDPDNMRFHTLEAEYQMRRRRLEELANGK